MQKPVAARPLPRRFGLALLLMVPLASGAAGGASQGRAITWDPATLEVTVFRGSSRAVPVRLVTDRVIDQATLFVVPELAAWLRFAPGLPTRLEPGGSHDLWALLDVSMDTPSGTYEGTAHLRSGSRTVPATLKVRIHVTSPTSTDVPSIVTVPSVDRVVRDADGHRVVRDELLVLLRRATADPDHRITQIAQATGGLITGSVPGSRLYSLQFPVSNLDDLDSVRIQLESEGDTSVVTRHFSLEPEAVPDDSQYWGSTPWGQITGPADVKWNLEAINAPAAWERGVTGDSEQEVWILDRSFDVSHADLRGNIRSADNSVLEASGTHGTKVAGVACAEGNNGLGIAGVSWRCALRLLAVPEGAGDEFFAMPLQKRMRSLLDEIREAAQRGDSRTRIVNMSLGLGCPQKDWLGQQVCPATTISQACKDKIEGYSRLLGAPIEEAFQEGREVLWVFSAGNGCHDAAHHTPGGSLSGLPGVVTVSAVRRAETPTLASYSNKGGSVDVAAPGGEIRTGQDSAGEAVLSTSFVRHEGPEGPAWQDAYAYFDGTSAAAPHVAGVAALVLSAHPEYTADQVRACIVASAANPERRVAEQAFGVVDAAAAVDCATACSRTQRTVSATTWWQDTGVAIAVGQKVTVSASGTWGDSAGSVGPAGRASQLLIGPPDIVPLTNRPIMLLVGRIGETGTPFAIGTGTSFTAQESGSLWLTPNDHRWILWDNYGSLDVKVGLGAACAPPWENTVVWSFSEGSGTQAADSSGKDNHGTVDNAVWAPGHEGTGLWFPAGHASTARVRVADNDTLSGTAIRLDFWTKPERFDQIGQIIVNKYQPHAPDNSEYAIWLNYDKLVLVSRGTEGLSLTLPAVSIWYHVEALVNGDHSEIRVTSPSMGAPLVAAGSLSPMSNGTQPFVVGGCVSYCEPHWTTFNGSIDEMRVSRPVPEP
jgi:subtilisin family serine protease